MKQKQTFSILIWAYRRKATDEEVTLYARVTVNGKRAEISLRKRINASLWDEENSIVKPNCEETREINEYLDIERGELRQCFYQLRSEKKQVTAEAIKMKYLCIEESGGKTLLEALQYHNDQIKGLIGKGFSLYTYKKYQITIGKVSSFLAHAYKRSDILLADLKYKFITDFEYYLRTVDNLSNNSAMGYIKKLKKVATMSVNNEWIPTNPFSRFVCKIEEKERDVLSDGDIEKLKAKKFYSFRLEQARDIFLFSCYTGYAYADVLSLTYNHVGIGQDGEKWIFTSRKKNDNRSNVFLLPEALDLIEKYKSHPECIQSGKLFPVRSNQKYNNYLKEVADLCDIKIELTTHIARHTFATTITLANDVPIESVSSMLGHKSLRTTQLYAKIVQKKLSNDMKALRTKLSRTPEERKYDAKQNQFPRKNELGSN